MVFGGDRRAFTLGPLVAGGILQHGPAKLSCACGGKDFFADLGPNGEILFEGKTFKSPSAFSVHVKRKLNPGRKADDGWTSVKYGGELLSTYRGQLDQLLRAELDGGVSVQTRTADDGRRTPEEPAGRPERQSRSRKSVKDWSSDSDTEEEEEEENKVSSSESDILASEDEARAAGQRKVRAVAEDCDEPQQLHEEYTGRSQYKPDMEWTWIQCESAACGKWRRVRYADVPKGSWQCSNNKDEKFNACKVPQELPDEEIDRLLEEEAMVRHVARSKRPPLVQCTAAKFEADVAEFLEARGEQQSATFIREKRITCNNSPLDLFGLYREVVARGGLLANARYDSSGRWIGAINFAGEIFPRMKNWTANNRATSVGNQLLNNYRKFLLAYEKAWAHKDLPDQRPPDYLVDAPAHRSLAEDIAAADDSARRDEGRGVYSGRLRARPQAAPLPSPTAAPENKMRAASTTAAQPLLASIAPDASNPASAKTATELGRDALAVLADVAGAGYSDGEVGVWRSGKRQRPWDEQDAEGDVVEVKRFRLEVVQPQHSETIKSLHAMWSAHGRSQFLPGELLLAADPRDPSRHWAVCAADVHDLPVHIATGGAYTSSSQGFPLSLQEASPSGTLESALPVVVIGTGWLGWVERASCRPFTPEAGASAQASVWAAINARSAPRSSGCLAESQQPLVACVRGLKLAAEFLTSVPHGESTATRRCWVQEASLAYSAHRLLELEGQMDAQTLMTAHHAFMAPWRAACKRASSPAELGAQVLALAHNISNSYQLDMSCSWQELRKLLGCMGPDALKDTSSQSSLPPPLPTCLSVDQAVSVIQDNIDWVKVRQAWANINRVANPLLPLTRAAGGNPIAEQVAAGAVATAGTDTVVGVGSQTQDQPQTQADMQAQRATAAENGKPPLSTLLQAQHDQVRMQHQDKQNGRATAPLLGRSVQEGQQQEILKVVGSRPQAHNATDGVESAQGMSQVDNCQQGAGVLAMDPPGQHGLQPTCLPASMEIDADAYQEQVRPPDAMPVAVQSAPVCQPAAIQPDEMMDQQDASAQLAQASAHGSAWNVYPASNTAATTFNPAHSGAVSQGATVVAVHQQSQQHCVQPSSQLQPGSLPLPVSAPTEAVHATHLVPGCLPSETGMQRTASVGNATSTVPEQEGDMDFLPPSYRETSSSLAQPPEAVDYGHMSVSPLSAAGVHGADVTVLQGPAVGEARAPELFAPGTFMAMLQGDGSPNTGFADV